MEFTKRLTGLWNWIPAFRAVAELEHLPTAAERLHISPSALSRSVRLLEEAVGKQLFDREGRRIVLNEDGRQMLAAVRLGMRHIDDALQSIMSGAVKGHIRVAAPGPIAALFVLPALRSLTDRYPELVPQVLAVPNSRVNAMLLAGDLDLAILDDPIRDADLELENIMSLTYGVYCGPGHPLEKARKLSVDRILEHPFAAPPAGADDHWPAHLERRIGLELGYLQLGLDCCAQGELLAVLPDVVAAAHHVPLRRLPFDDFSETSLFAMYRQQITSGGKTELLLEAIRDHLPS